MENQKRIEERIALYEKDLMSCIKDYEEYSILIDENDPKDIGKIKLVEECDKRIEYYVPAIKELKWVLTGQEYPLRRDHYRLIYYLNKSPTTATELSRIMYRPTKNILEMIDTIEKHANLLGGDKHE